MNDDLEKARMQQWEFNDRCKTEPLRQVQAIRCHDDRIAAIMRTRKSHVRNGNRQSPGWMELCPLNNSVFLPGETVECDGRDSSGAECIVMLRIGSRCGPKNKWVKAYILKAVRKIKVPLEGKDGE